MAGRDSRLKVCTMRAACQKRHVSPHESPLGGLSTRCVAAYKQGIIIQCGRSVTSSAGAALPRFGGLESTFSYPANEQLS